MLARTVASRQAKSYIHTQGAASNVWNVQHNKNTALTPVVSVFSEVSSGVVSCGTITCGDGRSCGQSLQYRMVPVDIQDIEVQSVNALVITVKKNSAGKAVIQFI